MGYSFFQYSGATFDPKRIKRMVDEVGTPVRLTHMDKDRLLNETEGIEKIVLKNRRAVNRFLQSL